MTTNMAVAERSVNKYEYKALLYLLKILPMFLAACNCLNTYLSFYGFEVPLISYLGGISFAGWLFIYLAAIVFRFCLYHRMFLYYVLLNNLLSIYEFHIGIPVSDAALIRIYTLITGIFLFVILILYRREKLCFKR